jgi:hypothetical protein
MAGWIDELLKEWRAHFDARVPRDHAPALEEDGPPPTHALDLLRVHVARSGVQLTLSDPTERRQASDRRAARVKAIDTKARETVPERGAGAGAGSGRFGRRQYPASAEGATERLALLPQNAVCTPAESRRAAQAFRASAFGEVEALRADVARLKEALADVLVENRSLKRTLEAQRAVEAG